MRLIVNGKDNSEIASSLSINIRTIANHVSNILFKMKAKNRTAAGERLQGERGLFEGLNAVRVYGSAEMHFY